MIETSIRKTSLIERVARNLIYADKGGQRWYGVYTVARHENAADSALVEKNIETFLPLMEVGIRGVELV